MIIISSPLISFILTSVQIASLYVTDLTSFSVNQNRNISGQSQIDERRKLRCEPIRT